MISQGTIPDILMSTKESPCGEQTLSEKKIKGRYDKIKNISGI